uniref:C-type lectin domain-containing protein n=1 Tax=Branchiostoma floridae TaxID=7739 RepID=C3YZZ3_BRAFL|eukprot:XP_002598040.1 hypothetical protein BRAFLDRAFT_252948 [Branchiostoma floridae]
MNYLLPETGCPNGYEYYQPSRFCYKAFNQEIDRSNYNDAAATCASEGGTLAMPSDAGINAFLLSLKNAGDFWFGLSDRGQEGRFVWANGVPLGHFNHWAPEEPNDHDGGEDCAHYWVDKGDRWNDNFCDKSMKFICQVAT